jgi:alkaline phosphatase D
MANYAIWDDRDYGDSDDDRTNPMRLEVAAIFERYWANPSYGVEPGLDGIYSHVRIGGAEVFLLDDRFWRDPDSLRASPSKTILGRAQKEWLFEALAASDAPLKVIAIGHQVLVDYHEWESYAMFAHERGEILDWIRDRRIGGVVFVDGDRHLSELMRDEREGLYPLYELTASPIANRPFTTGLELPNPIRIGGYGAGDSYGILDLDTTRPPGRLTLRIKDAEGNEVVRHEVSLDEIRFDD